MTEPPCSNTRNYGRISNNVRLQDATFQQLVAAYQNSVLNAQQDVENGLVTFLRAQERAKFQASSEAFDKLIRNQTVHQPDSSGVR